VQARLGSNPSPGAKCLVLATRFALIFVSS